MRTFPVIFFRRCGIHFSKNQEVKQLVFRILTKLVLLPAYNL